MSFVMASPYGLNRHIPAAISIAAVEHRVVGDTRETSPMRNASVGVDHPAGQQQVVASARRR